jgi:hypothetical protein
MGKLNTILLIVLILVVIVVGYFIYKSLNKPIVTIENSGTFNGTQVGTGIGPYAKCSEGKKAISGGCVSHSQYLEVVGTGTLTKSNANLKYDDAWQCAFRLKETNEYFPHPYTVTVNCK